MLYTIQTLIGFIVLVFIGGYILKRIIQYFLGRGRLDMTNRWIVVTGCDSGIGEGVMKALIARNASVIAFCYSENGMSSALKAGAKHAFQLDITDQESVQKTTSEVLDLCNGQLWSVIHIAGMVRAGFIEFQPLENYHRVMDVNFFAIVNITQKLIPAIKAARGRITIVTSVDGIVSLPGNAPYDASKFATEGYADALRVELSFWNIHVAVTNPATMKTPLVEGFFNTQLTTWDMMHKINPDGEWKKAYTREWVETHTELNNQRTQQIASDPKYAINDIVHSVTSTKPKERYLSGQFAKTLFYALWIMPESWAHILKKSLIEPRPEINA